MVKERLKFVAKKHFEILKRDENVRSLIELHNSFAMVHDCKSPLDLLV